jgi:hypothetical protein
MAMAQAQICWQKSTEDHGAPEASARKSQETIQLADFEVFSGPRVMFGWRRSSADEKYFSKEENGRILN